MARNYGKPTSINLTDREKEILEVEANKLGMRRSTLIRMVLRVYIEERTRYTGFNNTQPSFNDSPITDTL